MTRELVFEVPEHIWQRYQGIMKNWPKEDDDDDGVYEASALSTAITGALQDGQKLDTIKVYWRSLHGTRRGTDGSRIA